MLSAMNPIRILESDSALKNTKRPHGPAKPYAFSIGDASDTSMTVVFMLLPEVAAAPPPPDLKPQKAKVPLLPSGPNQGGALPKKLMRGAKGRHYPGARTDNPILEITTSPVLKKDWFILLAGIENPSSFCNCLHNDPETEKDFAPISFVPGDMSTPCHMKRAGMDKVPHRQ
jgi:hypothetical protein